MKYLSKYHEHLHKMDNDPEYVEEWRENLADPEFRKHMSKILDDHNQMLQEDEKYREAFFEYKDKKIREYWETLQPFETNNDIPNIPNPINDFYINKLIELGAVPKKDLKEGEWYYGDHRRCVIAKWDGGKFKYVRQKFNFTFWDECNHFEDDNGYALFVPLRKATDEEIKSQLSKLDKK